LDAVLVEVVAVLGRALALSISVERDTARLVLKGIGVPRATPGKVVDSAVQPIAAALQDDVDTAGATILRVVGIGLDFELLHRVHRRDKGDVIAACLGIVG
jgi:hypothetical protein